MTCRPGHPPRHPEFEPDNVVALRHGAWSPRRWRPVADRLAAELCEVAPWTARQAFAADVAAWARAEAQATLLADWLDEHGLLDDDGNPRPATMLAHRLEVRAANLRAALGLNPTAWARLAVLVQAAAGEGDQDVLTALRAEGRALLAAQHAVPPRTADDQQAVLPSPQGATEAGEMADE